MPLVLQKEHAALVATLTQPLTFSEWPGCLFLAVSIRVIYYCCRDTGVLEAVNEQIDKTLARIYAQVTIDVLKALEVVPIFKLP